MAKGWTKLETVFDVEKKSQENRIKEDRKWSNLIRNTKIRSFEQMKKDADQHYEEQIAYENSLLEAFNNKQLKSKNLIKQAIRLKKIKEQKKEKE